MKIKGGIYKGEFWNDFINKTAAKRIGHKQDRKRNKDIIRKYNEKE